MGSWEPCTPTFTLRLEGATLVGVRDREASRANEFSEKWGAKVFDSAEAMINDPEIDLIDICLPTDQHAKYTVLAANAGKHVICEKPMALSLDEADSMVEAAEQAGVKFMIAHCIRFWPEYQILENYVRSGELGELQSINLLRYGAFPTYTLNNWAANPEVAGGAMDMHIHDTDFILYLLGEPDKMSSWGSKDDRGVGHFFTTMTYGNTVAHLEGGWNLPAGAPFSMEFRAIFSDGAAIYRDGKLTIYRDGHEPFTPEVAAMEASGAGGNLSSLGGYYNELAYLVDCIENDKPVEVATPQSSRQSLAYVLDEVEQIESKLS